MMRAILLVDGRSGSGKTEFARALVAGWPQAQLLRMDDLYPGWGGLQAGAGILLDVLRSGRWRRYDWNRGGLAEWHELDPARPLVVEGVGCLTRATRAHAELAVWVQTDAVTRRRRALQRDAYFAERWGEWAAQEEALIAREGPSLLADAVLSGYDVARDAALWRRRAQRVA